MINEDIGVKLIDGIRSAVVLVDGIRVREISFNLY